MVPWVPGTLSLVAWSRDSISSTTSYEGFEDTEKIDLQKEAWKWERKPEVRNQEGVGTQQVGTSQGGEESKARKPERVPQAQRCQPPARGWVAGGLKSSSGCLPVPAPSAHAYPLPSQEAQRMLFHLKFEMTIHSVALAS